MLVYKCFLLLLLKCFSLNFVLGLVNLLLLSSFASIMQLSAEARFPCGMENFTYSAIISLIRNYSALRNLKYCL